MNILDEIESRSTAHKAPALPEHSCNCKTPCSGQEPEYLTADQLRRKLSVSLKAVQKWTAQRRIPCVKVGYHWRYPSNEINKRLLSGLLLAPMTKGK